MVSNHYEEEFKRKVLNSALQPSFDEHGYLRGLAWEAETAITRGEISDYIAATIIYQQLIEQFLINLLEWSEFFIQLKVYPIEIHIVSKEELTLGQIIEECNRLCIVFDKKDQLIGQCRKFNKIRRYIAHGMSKGNDENEIFRKTEGIQELYEEIMALWFEAGKWFCKRTIPEVNRLKENGVV